jgi:hypothetical protein
VFTKNSIEVDGNDVPITCEKPRGLFMALLKSALDGHVVSAITFGAMMLSLLALLVVMAGFVIRGLR